LFKHAIIQGAMIKGSKKEKGWWRKWSDIKKVTCIPPGIWLLKYAEKKRIFDLTWNSGNSNYANCLE